MSQNTVNALTAAAVVEPATVLRTAANYLERHGWTQGTYYDNPDRARWPTACALGAIGVAVYGKLTQEPESEHQPGWSGFDVACWVLRDYLTRAGLLSGQVNDMSIGDWNDQSDQTAEAVIITLQEAADEWDHTNGGVG